MFWVFSNVVNREMCSLLIVLSRYANRQHPYHWLLSRYHYTYVCLEIFILHNLYIYIYIKCELQSACSIVAFKRSLSVLILHNQTLIKVWNTLHFATKYWILVSDGWNNYYSGHIALFSRKFWHLLPMLILHSFYTYTVRLNRQLLRSSRSR